ALDIAIEIAKLGCQVQVVEPNISELPDKLDAVNVQLVSLAQSLSADIVCILVKHKPFGAQTSALTQHGALVDAVGLTS
ncbi:UDP-N-acetyl-D-mannosamine dehydrogenase, partial [Rheinheimera baltica]|nr:UDP-N-acetyl-D-mannosamine dehydrogenase [Rheinheimera baltica]